MEDMTLPELERDLWEYHQNHEAGNCSDEEYAKAVANLTAAIEARKVVIEKQRIGKDLDRQFQAGKLTRQEYHRKIDDLTKANQNKAAA